MIAQKEKYTFRFAVNLNYWCSPAHFRFNMEKIAKERRTHRKKWESLAALLSCNITAYSGITKLIMHVIEKGDPFAETSTSIGGRYGGRKRQFCTTDAEHHLTLRKDWFTRVFDKGLMFVDNIFTMDAEEHPCYQQNTKLWEVVYLRYHYKKLQAQKGYIAQHGATSYHGSTPRSALAGLKNKRTKQVEHAIRQRAAKAALRMRVEDELRILRQHMDVEVNMEDSLAAGNCRAGTEQFIRMHFYGRSSATISEIVKVAPYNRDAIRACKQAINKQEKEKV